MLTTAQDFIIVIFTVAAALLMVRVLNRFWPSEKRRAHNDLIGWQLSILGTTYAVMLGFMLYTVWTDFGVAELNVDAEANAVVNVYRLAEGLPEVQRAEVKRLARAYATAAIQRDWPAMARNSLNFESNSINRAMWHALMSVKAASSAESTAEDHALSELSDLTKYRRIRQLQSTSRLPAVLWCVLIIGGAVTIVSSCMFGSGSTMLHGMQVFSFSLLIALVLVAIADINRPFQGSVHVSDAAFHRAQQNMDDQ
jgi:uncharacterized protein DUF4239